MVPDSQHMKLGVYAKSDIPDSRRQGPGGRIVKFRLASQAVAGSEDMGWAGRRCSRETAYQISQPVYSCLCSTVTVSPKYCVRF